MEFRRVFENKFFYVSPIHTTNTGRCYCFVGFPNFEKYELARQKIAAGAMFSNNFRIMAVRAGRDLEP